MNLTIISIIFQFFFYIFPPTFLHFAPTPHDDSGINAIRDDTVHLRDMENDKFDTNFDNFRLFFTCFSHPSPKLGGGRGVLPHSIYCLVVILTCNKFGLNFS